VNKLLLIGVALPLAATAAEPLSTSCTHSGEERIIEIVYPEGTELPCEVQYTKNGETRTLWTASGQAGFCESKAEEFVAKQRSWGWQCDSEATATEEAVPPVTMATAGSADKELEGHGGAAGEESETAVELETD